MSKIFGLLKTCDYRYSTSKLRSRNILSLILNMYPTAELNVIRFATEETLKGIDYFKIIKYGSIIV